MANLHMGYVGSAKIGATQYFITGSGINPVQEFNTPELIQGRASPYLWNWGKIEVQGNITGPLHETASNLWTDAWTRTSALDHMANQLTIDICYYKQTGRQFTTCYINSYEVTVTAGDVANFTVDFMGSAPTGTGVNTSPTWANAATPQRLITWDVCQFTGIAGDIQGFSFNLANNLQRGYACGSGSYAPFDVVAGMRKLSGTVTIYAEGAPGNNDAKDNFATTVPNGGSACSFDIGGAAGGGASVVSKSFTALLKRSQAAAKTDLVTYTIDYQAIAFDNLV